MTHIILVDGGRYTRPVQHHGDDCETELRMSEYRPFGIVPPIRWLGIHGWLVAYVVLVVAMFVLFRWLLGIW